MGWKNKYPDEMLRRYLEENGVTVADYFTDGAMYYNTINGQDFLVMDDDDTRAAVIVRYLERLGQMRKPRLTST